MSLWTAPCTIDPEALHFTAGQDRVLDEGLLPWDCLASKAHAEGLVDLGVLSSEEMVKIAAVLEDLRLQALAGLIRIPETAEDGHDFIEQKLTDRLGSWATRIHSYRSRNDQVWTALLLFIHERLEELVGALDHLGVVLDSKKAEWGHAPLPGYTHTRKAMPSSVADWIDLYQSALEDSRRLLVMIRDTIHRSPLGSGAGYGFRKGPDRHKNAVRMGFDGILDSVMYAQASRSKYAGWVTFACASVMQDLNRLASDLILFSLPEFGYFKLPEEMLLGSSVMPHKRNPDVLELVRGNYSMVLAHQQRVMTVCMNLIYGYHRDLQLTKLPLMESLQLSAASLNIMVRLMKGVWVDEGACLKAMSSELKSVDEALELVAAGIPFREAHARVAAGHFSKGRRAGDKKNGGGEGK